MTTLIESGVQLLARVTDYSKKPLEGLDEQLFPEGLGRKQTVEINGDPGSGKTLLLTQLIAACILPLEYNGLDIIVLLINADHHFQLRKLTKIMKKHLKISDKSEFLDDTKTEEIIELSLKNLLIINCTNYHQFICHLYSLPSILSSNNKIGIVALDSISAFYWQARETEKHLSLSSHTSNILKTIQQATFQFSVKTIFTKQADFELKTRFMQNTINGESTLGEVNHRIHLSNSINSSQGLCKAESFQGSRSFNYEITETGLKWLISTNL